MIWTRGWDSSGEFKFRQADILHDPDWSTVLSFCSGLGSSSYTSKTFGPLRASNNSAELKPLVRTDASIDLPRSWTTTIFRDSIGQLERKGLGVLTTC